MAKTTPLERYIIIGSKMIPEVNTITANTWKYFRVTVFAWSDECFAKIDTVVTA